MPEWLAEVHRDDWPKSSKSAENMKKVLESMPDLSSGDVETFYKVLFNAKDGARYIAKKNPSENLEFKAFKISAR